jgi:hypothetical protein
MSSMYSEEVRAAFTRGLVRAVGGQDSVEQGIQVQVIDLASATADKFTGKLIAENARWDSQLAQFSKDSVSETDERFIAAKATHERIVQANSKWLDALEKAASV